MIRALSAGIAILVVVLVGLAQTTPANAQTTTISVDFNNVPDGVQRYTGGLGLGTPFCFLRDITGNAIPTTMAQHGLDGAAPPATHAVTDRRDLTYTARGHAMSTPFGVGGFQIIDNPIGSFVAGDRAEFSVDISTAGVASRKWPLIWFIRDGSLATALPVDPAFTDTVRDRTADVSVPGEAIFFRPERIEGGVGWGGWSTFGERFGEYWNPIPVAESFTARATHRYILDGRDIEVWVGGEMMWRAKNVVPASWSGQRIDVRLDFVDYNSSKDGDDVTTWHWDNVRLTGSSVKAAGSAVPAVTTPLTSPVPTGPAAAPTGPATASPTTPNPKPESPTKTPAVAPTGSTSPASGSVNPGSSASVPTRIRLGITRSSGSLDDLATKLASSGCNVDTIAVIVDGRFRLYRSGAPAFVNARIPSQLQVGQLYLYRCRGQ